MHSKYGQNSINPNKQTHKQSNRPAQVSLRWKIVSVFYWKEAINNTVIKIVLVCTSAYRRKKQLSFLLCRNTKSQTKRWTKGRDKHTWGAVINTKSNETPSDRTTDRPGPRQLGPLLEVLRKRHSPNALILKVRHAKKCGRKESSERWHYRWAEDSRPSYPILTLDGAVSHLRRTRKVKHLEWPGGHTLHRQHQSRRRRHVSRGSVQTAISWS